MRTNFWEAFENDVGETVLVNTLQVAMVRPGVEDGTSELYTAAGELVTVRAPIADVAKRLGLVNWAGTGFRNA